MYFCNGLFRVKFGRHQVAVTHDDGEDVVEIMRHAAGKLADHLHFLRLDELRFKLFAFGDVNAGADEARLGLPLIFYAR